MEALAIYGLPLQHKKYMAIVPEVLAINGHYHHSNSLIWPLLQL